MQAIDNFLDNFGNAFFHRVTEMLFLNLFAFILNTRCYIYIIQSTDD